MDPDDLLERALRSYANSEPSAAFVEGLASQGERRPLSVWPAVPALAATGCSRR